MSLQPVPDACLGHDDDVSLRKPDIRGWHELYALGTYAEARKSGVEGFWKLIHQRFFDQKPIRQMQLLCIQRCDLDAGVEAVPNRAIWIALSRPRTREGRKTYGVVR